jgi:restriction endonuclease S subunit
MNDNSVKQWQRYPAYKDSGVEWLGEVPEHWEVKRLKFNAPYSTTKFSNKPDNLTYIGLENIESGTGKLLIDEPIENVDSTVSYFNEGNILFGKLRPYLAKVIIAPFNGVSTSELICFQPTESYSNSYLFYLLLSPNFIHSVNALTYGTKMPRANPDQIANFLLSVPPLSEQQAIAQFLDRETAKIDTLIAKKERAIELLKEKRTALISHAVTKGLDPDAPMKDSGVEWLGEIPSHWEVYKNKNLFYLFNGYAFKGEFFSKEEKDAPILVTPGNFSPEGGLYFPPENTTHYLGDYPDEFELKLNDYLIVMTDLSYKKMILGSVIVVDREGLLLNQRVAKILLHDRARNNLFMPFLCYSLNSKLMREQVILTARGATVFHSSPDKIGACNITLPPISEQKEITNFLNTQTAKIDTLIAKTRTSIEKLKEYRTALISAAVTGKIDVRQTKGGDNTEM